MHARPVVLYNPMTAPLGRPHAPLSIMALARMLPRSDFRPVLVNAAAERRPHDRALEALPGAVLLGISAMTGYQIRDGLRLARKVRRLHPNTPIVWGGYHPSLLPRETAKDPCVDYVVAGQGERTFAELVACLAAGGPAEGIPGNPARIPGLAGPALCLPGGPMREPLDAFPHLPWDLVDLSKLRPAPEGGPAVDFYTSQGCPHACRFCAEASVHGRRRLVLSPGRAVEEIERLTRLGVKSIYLRDVLFFADPRWVEEFCRLILKRSLDVTFYDANGRVDGLLALSPGQWELFEEAGFREVYVGLESGHAPALERIGKSIAPEACLELLERLRGTRVRLSASVMVGLPGVDPAEELRDTLKLLRRIARIEDGRLRAVYVFTYVPYPGSELYAEALGSGFQPPGTLDGCGRFDFHRTAYPWGSRRERRKAVLLHRYVLPRILRTEPSRFRTVEAVCRLLDPRLRRRWEEGHLDRFWERFVYDALNGLRFVWRRAG